MQERRKAPRFILPVAVGIRRALAPEQSDALAGRVNDISSDGVCFTSQEHFTVGEKFEFSVTLPMDGMQTAEIVVEGQAMVVRVGQKLANENQRSCVAAVIEAFKIIRTKASASWGGRQSQ